MLIIAIPKSASTSLLHTLGEIHDLKSEQDFNSVKDNPIPSDFRLLGKYHSDCRNLIPQTIDNWDKTEQFYKQHIPPTKINLKLLGSIKKVILLRPPREIILAYRRADKKGLHESRTEFDGCVTEKEWLNRAREIGLHDELDRFYKGWINTSSDKHVIYFSDLVSEEKKNLQVISAYFNLPISDTQFNTLKLKKNRYSRYNSIQKYTDKALKRFRKFFRV